MGDCSIRLEKYGWTTHSGACSCNGGAVSLSGSRGLIGWPRGLGWIRSLGKAMVVIDGYGWGS